MERQGPRTRVENESTDMDRTSRSPEDAGTSKARKVTEPPKQTNEEIHSESSRRQVCNREYVRDTAKDTQKEYFWDTAQDTQDEDRYEAPSDVKWKRAYIVVTVIVRIILFVVVLGAAVISKLCFVLVASNIFPPMGTSSDFNLTKGSLTQKTDNCTLGRWWRKTAGCSIRYKNTEMDVQWIWAMFLIIIAPYFFTLMSSAWRWATGKLSPKPGRPWIILVIRIIPIYCFRAGVEMSVIRFLATLYVPGKHEPLGPEYILYLWNSPTSDAINVMLLFETLDSIGLCFMAFVLLPNIDPIAVILFCFNIAFTRGATGICCSPSTLLIKVINIIGFVLQLASIVFACTYYALDNKPNVNVLHPLLFLAMTIFVSFNWWQNISEVKSNQTENQHRTASEETSCVKANIRRVRGKIYNLVTEISDRRTKYNVIVSCWKIIITFIFPLTLFGASCEEGHKCTQTLFGLNTNASVNSIFGHTLLMSQTMFGPCYYNLPMITAAVGIICSGLCYKAVKLGFNILVHVPCVAVPLALSSPVAVAALVWILSRKPNLGSPVCDLPYPYWSTDAFSSENLKTSFYWMVIVSGLFGYASLIIITLYIWKPRNMRLQTSEELFTKPLYSGIFLDQSLQLNVRRVDRTQPAGDIITKECFTDTLTAVSKKTPRIYICATMWHEKKSEMEKFMKSVLRMDADLQKTEKFREVVDDYDDFFTFQVHIIFDDAFRIQNHPDRGETLELNEYVKNLIEVVTETTKYGSVDENDSCLKQKTKTCYGGRLTWILPSKNKVIAHLKNKSLIHSGKRRSQVMYMYYLLGYKQNLHEYITTRTVESVKNKNKASNTYILALDGDVDFKPEAVKYLMDRMRKDPKVGAACGRIHPTGKGPIVWFQKFEYAISHWLQKAAEDKLGCVLCSPGCFSLFRGSALQDHNVMKVYTYSPKEAKHHIQYDQGEDRWLCTLLLQQGYKIEYVAASDAFTEAPDKFKEFFNQRRRWYPSTMANILELIWDWKHVVKTNPNISMGYMLYQAFYMISAILVPGTTLLVIVHALSTAFPGLTLWLALLLNLIPIIVLIVLCLKTSCEIQMQFGVILSIGYSLQMMIVIVGLALHIWNHDYCSIITIFLAFVAGVFIIAAFLHPQETSLILHGFTYFIAIPVASIVMHLYCLCNLNVNSWGTRESSKNASTEKEQSLSGSVSNWLRLRCSCCTQETTAEALSRLEQFASNLHEGKNCNQHGNAEQQIAPVNNETKIYGRTPQNSRPCEESSQEHSEWKSTHETRMCSTISGHLHGSRKSRKGEWMRNNMLNAAKETKLKYREKKFWKRMIRKYLRPSNLTEEDNETINSSLTALRNKVCMFFFMINAMFILVVFALQQVSSEMKTLIIILPLTPKCSMEVGPISLAFTVVFGILLLLQFVCMLVHRFGTLIHICARTSVFESDDPIQQKKTLYQELCKESHDDKPDSSGNQVSPIDKLRALTRKLIQITRFTQSMEALKNYTKLKEKTKNKKDDMKAIKKEFPRLSTNSHRAIYRLLLEPPGKVP